MQKLLRKESEDVEWVEYELVNKTVPMLQLETKIHDYTNQLDLAEKGKKKHQIQTKLDKLKNILSTEISNIIFKLQPEQYSPKISIKHYSTSSNKINFCYKMKQIPANSNDATTGHKLQGMSKDAIVVTS
jgi:hypothetical protein